jgi:hypothetical protein
MSKKTFRKGGGLGSLLGDKPTAKETATKKRVGRPKTNFKEVSKTSEDGTKEGETRATFIVNSSLLDKLKGIAYWERIMIKEVIASALEEAVAKYEKKSGKVKPIPNK